MPNSKNVEKKKVESSNVENTNIEMYEQQENKNVLKHCINDIMMILLILLKFLVDCRILWKIKYGYKLYINTRLPLNFKS